MRMIPWDVHTAQFPAMLHFKHGAQSSWFTFAQTRFMTAEERRVPLLNAGLIR
jgi:hypothetical protein